MAFVVGLDIGTSSLTGAVIAGTASKFRLVDFFVEKIPTLGAETHGPSGEYIPPLSLEEFIQKTLADRKLEFADVVAAVESQDCVIRQFPVPFVRDDQIRKVISFEAENHFPIFSMDEVVLEYMKVGEAGGKSHLIVAALRNEVIESRLSALKKAGVDPVALDLDSAALFNSFALTPLYDPRKSTLLVDMGATSTKIVLVEEGRIKKIRSFRTGAAAARADRMLAEPAGVGAAAAGSTTGAAGGEAPGSLGDLIFKGHSLEARFQEIENALRSLDPISQEESRAPGEDLFSDTPIAILTDDEFARVHGAGGSSGPPGGEADDFAGEASETEMKPGRLESNAGDPEAAAHPGGEDRPVEMGGETGPEARARPSGAQRLADRMAFLQEKENGGRLDYGEYLERVGAEIRRTFATSASTIELICLTGGMSGGEDARDYFSQEFDVETVHFDFGDKFPSDLEAARTADLSRCGAVAVGLAVKEFGKDLVGLDFRKGRFRYEHRFSRLKVPLLALSILAFFFFLQTAFWAYHEHTRLSLRTAGFEAEMKEVIKMFFGKELPEGRDPVAYAQEQIKKWQGKGGGEMGKVIPEIESVRNFGEVMSATGVYFRIQTMKFDFKVKSQTLTGSKKANLVGLPSKVDLLADDKYANNTIRSKFADPKVSKFFDAQAGATPSKDGMTKVDLTLTPKPAVLSGLE